MPEKTATGTGMVNLILFSVTGWILRYTRISRSTSSCRFYKINPIIFRLNQVRFNVTRLSPLINILLKDDTLAFIRLSKNE